MLSEKQLKDIKKCGENGKIHCVNCSFYNECNSSTKSSIAQEALTYRNILKELLPDIKRCLDDFVKFADANGYQPKDILSSTLTAVEEIQTQLKESDE